ncbi:MAG: sigma 54-interacting transcriptional regulator [Bdellovibrionota bacterium]
MATKIASSEATVLIQGESGTGKEVVAKHIHRHSKRQGRPILSINCGALQENLLMSELFGHEKGAFTGAIAQRSDSSRPSTAVPCFWTKSARWVWRRRRNFCASCKREKSTAWERVRRSR